MEDEFYQLGLIDQTSYDKNLATKVKKNKADGWIFICVNPRTELIDFGTKGGYIYELGARQTLP